MKQLIKVSLLALSMLFMTSQSMAQGTTVGIKGGATFYQGVIEFMGVEETVDASTSYGGGIFVEMPLNQYVSIQPEVLLLMKKSEGAAIFGATGTINNSYIDVPLMLRFNIDVLDGITPYVLGGPYAGYLLKAESEQNGTKEDITDDFKSINLGAKIGGGLKLSSLSVEVMYDMGLMNIMDDDLGGNLSAKQSGLTLMLGISF